jgi:hypothetical protein
MPSNRPKSPGKWRRRWAAGKVFGKQLAAHHKKQLSGFTPWRKPDGYDQSNNDKHMREIIKE